MPSIPSLAALFLPLCWFVYGEVSSAQPPEEITNSIGMKLKLIPKGTFSMGSPPSEQGSHDDESLHQVTITQDYYLSVYEVTQAQYKTITGKNPSYFQGKVIERHPQTGRVEKEISIDSANYPVEQVTWDDAVDFCKRLSDLPQEKQAGRVYKLPTEAQWEYACRAGSQTAFDFGPEANSLGNHAWFVMNSNGRTHAVGEKQPNAWGLYDMHGNVWEWCSDWFGDYPKASVSDPAGVKDGTYRILRGGSWDYAAAYCRSANRNGLGPSSRYNDFGFRVALSSAVVRK